MSHESETTQKAQLPNKHHHHGGEAANPLQRRGFDESTPPQGWAALCIPFLRPPSNGFNRLINLIQKLMHLCQPLSFIEIRLARQQQ
jgi:hypothetical protein